MHAVDFTHMHDLRAQDKEACQGLEEVITEPLTTAGMKAC